MNRLVNWIDLGSLIKLIYFNGDCLFIDRQRFNNGFGTIIQLDYDTCKFEYSL